MTTPAAPASRIHEPACYGHLREEAATVREQLTGRPTALVNDLVDLTVGIAYLEALLKNARIRRYLERNHKTTLDTLEQLMQEVKGMPSDTEGTVNLWSFTRAQKELSEVIHLSRTVGPQMIKNVRYPVVMVVSVRRWKKIMRRYPEIEELFWNPTRRIPPAKRNRSKGASSLLSKKGPAKQELAVPLVTKSL